MNKIVLIVDDFNSTRKILQSVIQKAGHSTIEAANGAEALSYFDGRNIDLVLTDLNMPDMSGIELIKTIRKSPEYRRVPILMLTTERKPEKLDEAGKAGVTGILRKPVDINELINKVGRLLK